MRLVNAVSLGAVSLIAGIASGALVKDFPDSLKYKGKPLDPRCVVAKEIVTDPLNLSGCTKQADAEKGKVTYDTSLGDVLRDGDPDCIGCYESYSYVAKYNGAEVIITHWNGGGTGDFSTVDAIKRVGDSIVPENSYAGGDKCAGGVISAKVTERGVEVDQSATPYDFYEMAGLQTTKFSILDGNHNTACFGTKRTVNGRFLSYLPDDKIEDNSSSSADDPNICFIRMFVKEPKRAEWNRSQLKDFMLRFHKQCVHVVKGNVND